MRSEGVARAAVRDGIRPSAPVDEAGLDAFFNRLGQRYTSHDLTFVCIGTDRSTGDCLGPWVGMLLEERGFPHVHGTLRAPCDADKLPQTVSALHPADIVVAIDACLGRPRNVGRFLVNEGPIIPAHATGRPFQPVGTYSIGAIVNAVGPKPYWTLQTTSLYQVMGMARQIADAATRHLYREPPVS